MHGFSNFINNILHFNDNFSLFRRPIWKKTIYIVNIDYPSEKNIFYWILFQLFTEGFQ